MRGWPLAAAATLLIAVLPFLVARHDVDLLVFTAIYAAGGLGVGLLLGQCGIVTLAQSLFFAIGAYASAICSTTLGLPVAAGMLTGVLLSAAVAVAVGWPILRLTEFFLTLATLALAIIGNALFYEWDWLTGGTIGIGGIPKITALGFAFDTPLSYYYLVWVVLGLLMLLTRNLIRGRTGLSMRAVRDSSEAAMALAINIHGLRLRIFVLCAIMGSISGSLFAHYAGYVSVASFTVERGILFLLIPVLGGVRSISGTIVGSLFITFVPELLSSLGDFHGIVFGVCLVLVVLYMPGGVASAIDNGRKRLEARWFRKAPTP